MCFILGINDDAIVQAIVIFSPLLRVGKKLIRFLDGVEPDFSAGVGIPVRVMAHGKCAVCLLDVFGRGCRGDAKNIVWIFQ